MGMDYFNLIKGSGGSVSDKELTFGDLLSECRESAKEKVDEVKNNWVCPKCKHEVMSHSELRKGGICPECDDRGFKVKMMKTPSAPKDEWNPEQPRKENMGYESKLTEADYEEDNDELNKNKNKKKNKGNVEAGVDGKDVDEEGFDKEEEPENDMGDRSKDPDSDIPPPPDEVKDNDSPMEMRKEYLGKSEETHYYFITTEGGTGDIDDLVIADQDGIKKYSAKEQEFDISEESIPEFLIAAIRDIMIVAIERSIFLKYIYPKLVEEEPEENELEDELEEEPEEEPDMGAAPEEAKPPRESVVHEAKVDEQEEDEEVCPHCGYTGEMSTIEAEDESDNTGVFPKCPKCKQRTSDIALYWKEDADDSEVTEQVIDLSNLGDDELVAKHEELQAKMDSGEVDSRVRIKLNTMAAEIKKRGLSIDESKEFEESKARLFEITVVDDKGNSFEVFLMDDDEEATTISINNLEHTFDQYSKYFQDDTGKLTKEGLKELALDTLANLGEEEYNELAARAKEVDSQDGTADPDVAYAHNPNESKVEEAAQKDVAYDEKFVTWFMKGWNALPEDEKEDRMGSKGNLTYGEAQNQLRNIFDEDGVKSFYQRFKSGKTFESTENNKGNNMLDEKTVEGLIKDAERAEAKGKALRKQAADKKAADAKKARDEADEVKRAAAKKKVKKESVESEEVKTEILETDVAKGTRALVKLAKDALKSGSWTELSDHATKLKAIEDMIPPEAEAEAEAEALPEEAPEEAPEEDLEVPEEDLEAPEEDLEEDVVPKEDAVDEEVVKEDGIDEAAVEKKITDEKKAVPTCKKCSKKHWPFAKCATAKKESKIAVESTEDINETKQLQSLRNLLDM